jgi:hypothetical protein
MKLIKPSTGGSGTSGQPAPTGHPGEDGKPVMPINDTTARLLAQKVVAIIEQSDVFAYLRQKMGEKTARDQYSSRNWIDREPPEDRHPLDDIFGPEPSLLGEGEEPPARRLSQAMRGRSPAGGSIVRGSYYPGGKYLPSRDLR